MDLAARDVFAAAALCLLAAALAGLSLIAPINHDESQYLAAIRLAAELRPFADFLHLQTPLQITLFAPLAELAGSHALIALRIATALCGAGAIAFVFLALRMLRVRSQLALASAFLLALNAPLLFGATVVRNDALPALLEAAAITAAASALRWPSWRLPLWGLSGVLFAFAASAKISYLMPLAAFLLFHLIRAVQRRKGALTSALAAAAGAAFGLLPIALARAAAPEAFDYGVVRFALGAPQQWYAATGGGHRLTFASKIWSVGKALAAGPAAVALLFLALRGWRRRCVGRDEAELLVGLLTLGGICAALLPTPTWPQYLIPLLPPLFVGLGLEYARRPPPKPRLGLLRAALLLSVAGGLVLPLGWLRGGADRAAAVAATREAHWIGERLRANGSRGRIATLSPQFALDSGFPLDPRFATGPFFYRTGDRFPLPVQRRLHGISPSTLSLLLDEAPPAAIVTGYEENSRGVDLDAPLRAYAGGHGFRQERSPFGHATLHIAPRAGEAH